MPSCLRPILDDSWVIDLLGCLGVPYAWGVGAPGDAWPPTSCDCSGWAQMALVRLGLLGAAQPDRRSDQLALCCDRVAAADAKLGDLEFYGSPIYHVMVHLGGGWVIGARGGDSKTHGDVPSAYVDLRRVGYKADVQFTGRVRPEYSR